MLRRGVEPVGPDAVRRRVLTSVNMFFSNEEPDEATRQWYPRELWGISGGFLALAPGMSWLVEDMFGEMCARVALGEDEAAALPEGHGELVFFLYQRSYPLYGWLVGQGGKALVVAPNRRWLGCKTRLGVERRKGPRLEVFFREATGAAGATRPQLHAKFEHDYNVMMRTGSQGLPSYPDFLGALAQGRSPL